MCNHKHDYCCYHWFSGGLRLPYSFLGGFAPRPPDTRVEKTSQNPFKNVVQRKFQEVDSFNFKSPAKPEQHSQKYNIILKPKLLKGEEILLAVTYGSQSETWTLSKDDKFTSIGK